MANYFQGPYQLPRGSGGRPPPVRGSGPLSQPMGAPRINPSNYRSLFAAKFFYKFVTRQIFPRVSRSGSALGALAGVDPYASRQQFRKVNTVLEHYLPPWLYGPYVPVLDRPGAGWSTVAHTPDTPYGKYAFPGWGNPSCDNGFRPLSHVATQAGGSSLGCSATTNSYFTVPRGLIGTPIPSNTTIVYLGKGNACDTVNGCPASTRQRRDVTMVRPAGAPNAQYLYPQPVPVGDPGLQALPELAVGFADPALPESYVQAMYGGLGPVGRVNPRDPALKPYQVPVIGGVAIGGRGGPGHVGPPPPHNVLPPAPGEKERKFDLHKGNPVAKILGDAGGKLSELKDAVNALSESIKEGYSPRAGLRIVKNPCKGLSLHEKIACVVSNAGRIDPYLAVKNLALNELQDRAIGKVSQITNRNFARTGWNRGGRGFGISRFAQNKWR